MEFVGRAGSDVLISFGDSAVVVDEFSNSVVATGSLSTLTASATWENDNIIPNGVTFEIANAAVTNLDIKVFSDSDRMYTIPKAAQAEAKRALEWRKEEKRGGTPVGVNTARTLAKGGQIGIEKVRHIAKYFPRHEVDKKAKGYKPGEDGFPSNGRIAWALWGGDAAQRWASAIVERENKKAGNASTYEDIRSVDLAYFSTELETEFTIRVHGDGSGIDRLYMTSEDGTVQVWDDGSWNYAFKSFSEIDATLGTDVDGSMHYYFPVDPEAALVASAMLDTSPFMVTGVENINLTETEMVAAAMPEIDWSYIDSLTFADAAPKADGEYTEEERSKNASSQVRDASGQFAKMGGRVIISNNPSAMGVVESANADNQTVSVRLDNGSVVDVPANITEAVDENTPQPAPINDGTRRRFGQPLDVSGILGEPRDSSNPILAGLPNRLPPLTSESIQTMLTDWPNWVADQRTAYNANRQETPSVRVNTDAEDMKARNAYNDPYLRRWLDEKYSKKGVTSYPNRSWYNPVRTDDIEAKKSAKEVGYKGPSGGGSGGSGGSSWSWSTTVGPRGKTTTTRTRTTTSNDTSIIAAGEKAVALTPDTSDVPPIYMAIVAPDDPQAVMDLVSLVPEQSNSVEPTTFTRKDGKWVKDEGILADLNSPTPPPVIVLDDDSLKSVLDQMEGSKEPTTASIHQSLSILWGPTGDLVAVVAAGGADRNRGNAEKLRRYWTIGEGGAKIRWNTGGDWTRCVRQLSKYMGPRAKGYCALRHKEMTGLWTGDKAHRQMYGRKGAFSTYSDEIIRSSDEVISLAELSAQAAEARQRIVASGGPQAPGSEFYMPLVLPENVESGDGRKFTKGAISMRELPLPLMWQIKTAQGHDGSVVVGRIDKMERTDDGIGNAYGVFDSGEYGKEAERLVRGGFIKGISADLDRFEADEDNEETAADEDKKIGGGKIKITKGRIMGVTLVPKPAFQECKILLVDEIVDVQEDPMLPDGEYVEQPAEADAAALVACASVVASIPVTPPASWFENPKLNGATPLTVTDDGHVFGHIAAWHVDHIGMSMGTKPPRSKSKYAYFHTGIIRTEEGTDIPVGQLTLAGGHASLEASARAAAKHYDDTASAFADVHAGEDNYGIWVSGALRPSISPEQVRSIRASAPSGDWRPIQGALELVAVCQVNVPGFPIARARVASGAVMALVAAGAQVLARMKSDPVAELAARLDRLENPERESLLSTYEEVKYRFSSLKGDIIVSEEAITADGEMMMVEDVVEPMSINVLEKLLSDVVSMYFRAHGYHWNVKGQDFSQYHELFGEIYDDIYDSIDPLAENILKLGYDAPFNLGDFMKMRSIEDSEVDLHTPQALAHDLYMVNEMLVEEYKRAFSTLEAANEQGVADFLASRIDAHQKWSWQLRSSLVPEGMKKAEEQSDEDFFVTVFSALDDMGLIAAGGPSEAVRKELAKSGEALSDGSYPIRNVAELKKAIQAYGRSNPEDRAKVRRHIMKRARALRKHELIPEKWLALSANGMELSIAVADLRSRAKSTAMTAAGEPEPEEIAVEEEGGVDPKALTPKESTGSTPYKFTAKTQPRDAQGKFRVVLARLKQDLGTASLDSVAKKVGEAENLDNAGDYAASAKAANEVIGIVDRLETGALDAEAVENVRAGTKALGQAIANLPLPFQDQSQKIRFSDVPPALAKLIEDMIEKVENKIGVEDSDEATQKLKGFMSGSDVFSQGEISSEMNRLLRLLT
jgi:DNA-binding ferritin-like protein